jgi:ubiquinone/menaquinone biosynthesis C-methylase UbiE
MRFDSPEFLAEAYGDDHGLKVRIETHRLYDIDRRDIFDLITIEAARRLRPQRVLDVGAGTGNWYHALRRTLEPSLHYVGIDSSAGMVASLQAATDGDARAEAQQGDAQVLAFPDQSFDWVGLHFMLYHVHDIAQAIVEALRVLRPGGLMLAATTSASPYRELFELVAEALRTLGYEAGPVVSPASRFSLEEGETYMPLPAERFDYPGGMRFDQAEPALRFLASGPLGTTFAQSAVPPALMGDALAWIGERIERVISEHGSFVASSTAGFFLLKKPSA